MALSISIAVIFSLTRMLQIASAATCNLEPSYQAPVLASGWSSKLVAQDLTNPRSILFDSNGGLLVVEQGSGIVHLQLDDGGGTCVDVVKKTYIINSTDVCPSSLSPTLPFSDPSSDKKY